MTEPEIKINRGLKGVYFERSGVSRIDGSAGELEYRGYSIHDLATQSTFEETAYLLIYGELPTASELAAFVARLKASYDLPIPVTAVIRALPDCHPMIAKQNKWHASRYGMDAAFVDRRPWPNWPRSAVRMRRFSKRSSRPTAAPA